MAVVETDPNPVVLPPQTVQRGHDELVSRQVADRRQLAAVLSQPTTSRYASANNAPWRHYVFRYAVQLSVRELVFHVTRYLCT